MEAQTEYGTMSIDSAAQVDTTAAAAQLRAAAEAKASTEEAATTATKEAGGKVERRSGRDEIESTAASATSRAGNEAMPMEELQEIHPAAFPQPLLLLLPEVARKRAREWPCTILQGIPACTPQATTIVQDPSA